MIRRDRAGTPKGQGAAVRGFSSSRSTEARARHQRGLEGAQHHESGDDDPNGALDGPGRVIYQHARRERENEIATSVSAKVEDALRKRSR